MSTHQPSSASRKSRPTGAMWERSWPWRLNPFMTQPCSRAPQSALYRSRVPTMCSPPPNGEATSPITTQDERRVAKCKPRAWAYERANHATTRTTRTGASPRTTAVVTHARTTHARTCPTPVGGNTHHTHANPLPREFDEKMPHTHTRTRLCPGYAKCLSIAGRLDHSAAKVDIVFS